VRRAVLLFTIALAGCGADARHTPDAHVIDGPPDAPPDAAGSNSAVVMGGLDPSPRDPSLELGVLAISLGVVLAPVGARRKRLASSV
jgi:hypothetical protein